VDISNKPNMCSSHYFSVLPLNWTVGVPGILAATVEDALITLVYSIP